MRRNLSVHAALLDGAPFATQRTTQADMAEWLRAAGMLDTAAPVHALSGCARAHAEAVSECKRGTVVVDCPRP